MFAFAHIFPVLSMSFQTIRASSLTGSACAKNRFAHFCGMEAVLRYGHTCNIFSAIAMQFH